MKQARSLASLSHDGVVRYNSCWIEPKPDLWQVMSYILVVYILFKKILLIGTVRKSVPMFDVSGYANHSS